MQLLQVSFARVVLEAVYTQTATEAGVKPAGPELDRALKVPGETTAKKR